MQIAARCPTTSSLCSRSTSTAPSDQRHLEARRLIDEKCDRIHARRPLRMTGDDGNPPEDPKARAKAILIELAKALARRAAKEGFQAEMEKDRAAAPRASAARPVESAATPPTRSRRRPSRFTEADVKRAIAGVKKSGLPIAQVRIDPDGYITVDIGEPAASEGAGVKAWDDALGIARPPARDGLPRKKRRGSD